MYDWIEELVKEFKNSVPSTEENLVETFQEYLYAMYRGVVNSQSKLVKKEEQSVRKTISFAADELIQADLKTKKRILLKDVNLEKIDYISKKAFQMAIDSLKDKVVINVSEIDDEMEQLQQLVDKVEKENVEYAKYLVSEGILDLNFVKNPHTKGVSLRLGKELQNKEKRTLKEQDNLLPIGTVVLLKNSNQKLMITSFFVKDGTKQEIWEYGGCIYPEGFAISNQIHVFHESDIEKICHYGLIDEEELQFKKYLMEWLEKNTKE